MSGDAETIGRYVVRGECFAEGGTADRAARRKTAGPIVWGKRMHPADALDKSFVWAFPEGADLAVKPRHPNIVRDRRVRARSARAARNADQRGDARPACHPIAVRGVSLAEPRGA